MRLLRYGMPGEEKPGLLDSTGKIRGLGEVLEDISAGSLGAGALDVIDRVNIDRLDLVPGEPRIGPPVAGIGKIVCIGLNYRDHAAESGMPAPDEPVIF